LTGPRRHWRTYDAEPQPPAGEALAEPLLAFPSWFLRIECDRCGKVRMVNKAHVTGAQRVLPIRGLTAHPVVRDADGSLFYITPLEQEDDRRGMQFIPHMGSDRLFFAAVFRVG
jgi:hypothetical protein